MNAHHTLRDPFQGSTARVHQLGNSQSTDCYSQFTTKNKNVKCCSPTNDTLDDKKEKFYDHFRV